ncbi:MAG: UDP-N-acetylmuramoyl-L-alanine--D-glutamate ligase [Chlamydiota bacterium]
MKKLVLGFGISGKSSAQLLKAQGYEVVALDKKARELQSDPDIEVALDAPDFSLDSFSQVILSPGIPFTHPIVQKARALGIEVIGEIELGARMICNPCIGVTGSNGKTTTVLLIAHILNSAGIKARALGNVGASLTSYLLGPIDLDEILVLELSSFQLEALQTPCLDAALILNITPNHLDRHPSFEAYARAKIHIQNCLKMGKKLFTFQRVVDAFGDLLKKENLERIDCAVDYDPSVRHGIPERQNVEAAYALCSLFGVRSPEFKEGLKTFRKPPHRIEWVADIDGVSYYNDSKSTSVDSVMHAVALFSGPILLILGGVDKGASYSPWIEAFKGKIKCLIAYGKAAEKMKQELSFAFSFEKVETLEEALIRARLRAEEKETVLFSPGCSSYDQFKNYEHRGEEFKRYVKLDMREKK